MRGSVRFTIRSKIELNILKEAAEFVSDFEGDMCVELSHFLVKTKGKHFDYALADIVEIRQRVVVAGEFLASINNTQVGDDVYIGSSAQDVLDRGLESFHDQLNDDITAAFYTDKFKNGTDAAGITELRESVELAISRVDTCEKLLNHLRKTLDR